MRYRKYEDMKKWFNNLITWLFGPAEPAPTPRSIIEKQLQARRELRQREPIVSRPLAPVSSYRRTTGHAVFSDRLRDERGIDYNGMGLIANIEAMANIDTPPYHDTVNDSPSFGGGSFGGGGSGGDWGGSSDYSSSDGGSSDSGGGCD